MTNFLLPPPKTIVIYPWRLCHLSCDFCWQHQQHHTPKALDWWRGILSVAQYHGIHAMLLSGGEPFYSTDAALDLLEYARGIGMGASVSTSGYFTGSASNALAARLRELDISINFSLHGTREAHDQIVGTPGAFDISLNTLIALRAEQCKVFLVAVATDIAVNTGDLPKLLQLAQHTKCQGMFLAYPRTIRQPIRMTIEHYMRAVELLNAQAHLFPVFSDIVFTQREKVPLSATGLCPLGLSC